MYNFCLYLVVPNYFTPAIIQKHRQFLVEIASDYYTSFGEKKQTGSWQKNGGN